MHRRTAIATLAALFLLVPIALGGSAQKVTLTLDWTPNPDHVGFYDAQETGLFARAERRRIRRMLNVDAERRRARRRRSRAATRPLNADCRTRNADAVTDAESRTPTRSDAESRTPTRSPT